jgi:Bacterial SH3 domain.
MKKTLYTGLIALLLLLCLFGTQSAFADQIWQFNCEATIYEQTDLNSPKLATAQPGQIYIITYSTFEQFWHKIQYQDMQTWQMVEGWLKSDQLAAPSTLTNPPNHYHPGLESWVLQSPGTIYPTADENTPGIAEARPGQAYTIMDFIDGTRWIKIAYTDIQSGEMLSGWLNELSLESDSLRYQENAAPDNSIGSVSEGRAIGFVLCESLTVRADKSGAAAAIASFKYAETFEIMQTSDGWYQANCDGTVGWVNAQYVLKNPAYYFAAAETAAYAYPAPDAKRVGLLSQGTTLPIILEMDGYYVVSLRGASAFIVK